MVKRAYKTSGTIWRFVYFNIFRMVLILILRSGVQGRLAQTQGNGEDAEESKGDDDATE